MIRDYREPARITRTGLVHVPERGLTLIRLDLTAGHTRVTAWYLPDDLPALTRMLTVNPDGSAGLTRLDGLTVLAHYTSIVGRITGLSNPKDPDHMIPTRV